MKNIQVCCNVCQDKYQCDRFTRNGYMVCCCFDKPENGDHVRDVNGEFICCNVCVNVNIIQTEQLFWNTNIETCRMCLHHVALEYSQGVCNTLSAAHWYAKRKM
jgi:hypothetical protein